MAIKIGTMVKCPPDRGDKGYSAMVVEVGNDIQTNLTGSKFVWVTVKKVSGSKHVWPSNRLGLKI